MKNIDDRPIGAVENGAVFMDRIERDYEFSCEAGVLNLCSDWIELRMCFEVMADYIRHKSDKRAEAAEAELAQIKAQKPIKLMQKVKNHINEMILDCTQCEDQDMDQDFAANISQLLLPLYAAPIDQTAEIERLREALREVHTMIEHDRTGKFKMVQNVINAAISEKEPS